VRDGFKCKPLVLESAEAQINEFRHNGKRDRRMTYTITEPCIGVKDASCVEVCPVDCIHSDDDAPQYYINPDECIDCGACEPVCPVSAIFPEDAVPDEWKHFTELNAAYYTS
jgi:ferredoxin